MGDNFNWVGPVLEALTDTLSQAVGVLLEMVKGRDKAARGFAIVIVFSVVTELLLAILGVVYIVSAAIAQQPIQLGSVLLVFFVVSVLPVLGFMFGIPSFVQKANSQSLEGQFANGRENLRQTNEDPDPDDHDDPDVAEHNPNEGE